MLGDLVEHTDLVGDEVLVPDHPSTSPGIERQRRRDAPPISQLVDVVLRTNAEPPIVENGMPRLRDPAPHVDGARIQVPRDLEALDDAADGRDRVTDHHQRASARPAGGEPVVHVRQPGLLHDPACEIDPVSSNVSLEGPIAPGRSNDGAPSPFPGEIERDRDAGAKRQKPRHRGGPALLHPEDEPRIGMDRDATRQPLLSRPSGDFVGGPTNMRWEPAHPHHRSYHSRQRPSYRFASPSSCG